MNKLTLSQIMTLSEKLEHNTWIIPLMQLNDAGKIELFFEMIGKTELLKTTLKKTNNQHTK